MSYCTVALISRRYHPQRYPGEDVSSEQPPKRVISCFVCDTKRKLSCLRGSGLLMAIFETLCVWTLVLCKCREFDRVSFVRRVVSVLLDKDAIEKNPFHLFFFCALKNKQRPNSTIPNSTSHVVVKDSFKYYNLCPQDRPPIHNKSDFNLLVIYSSDYIFVHYSPSICL